MQYDNPFNDEPEPEPKPEPKRSPFGMTERKAEFERVLDLYDKFAVVEAQRYRRTRLEFITSILFTGAGFLMLAAAIVSLANLFVSFVK